MARYGNHQSIGCIPQLGDGFFSRILFFNTMIYSVLFGLPFVLLGILERGGKSED